MSKNAVCKSVHFRNDWEAFDILISTFYLKYLKKNKRPPTQAQIADVLQVHRNTIAKHFNRRTLKQLTNKYKPLTDSIILKHYRTIQRTGNDKLIKLWYQLVEDFSERKEITGSEGKEIKLIIRPAVSSDYENNLKELVE